MFKIPIIGFVRLILSALVFPIIFIRYNIPGWVTPYVTLLAVIVALFREKILEFCFCPELEIIPISTEPEHFHEVDDNDDEGNFLEKQSWLGIRIKNVGSANAKNVEVYFSGVESNIIPDFKSYRHIPLVRSWLKKPSIKLLPPKVDIRWDICYLPKLVPDMLNFSFLRTPNALRKIKCKSNQKSTFKFKVTALADNAKSKESIVEITFRGKYEEGFKVKPL